MAEDEQKRSSICSQICSVLLWSALSIAMIVLGALYMNQCQIQPMIPIYLIVAGSLLLFGFALLPLKLVSLKVTYAIKAIVGLFSLGWCIAGSVWVFSIYQTDPRDCNSQMYKFAFGVLIFQYICIAFVLLIVCLCARRIGLLSARDPEEAQPKLIAGYRIAGNQTNV
ncbi:transmembrane protein 272-like [Hyperolius riggenbachi]|uniref:transmembrane protein 272-like n=1 Tax=Hyperolius riggenbachi TaxID=752182 RepID=UPI0035A279D9